MPLHQLHKIIINEERLFTHQVCFNPLAGSVHKKDTACNLPAFAKKKGLTALWKTAHTNNTSPVFYSLIQEILLGKTMTDLLI